MSGRVEHLAEGVTLYLGDCRDILPTLGKVDAIITDPPFGIGNFVQTTGNVRGNAVTWNNETPSEDLFQQMREMSTHRIIWGANFFNCFEPNGGALIWVKNQPMPNFSKAEIASSSHLKKTELINLTWTNFVNSKETQHPCERPVDLYRWCIEYLPYSETIVDPFLGSGSCGVAAVNLGRKFIGIELDPYYFDISCQRISDALDRPDFFIEKPLPLKQMKMESML